MGKYIIHLIKYLLFFLLYGQLQAQDYIVNVQQFGIEEGLAQRKINCLFKDENGLLWIGGHDNLQCYDGYGFREFALPKYFGLADRILQDENGLLCIINSNSNTVFMNPFSGALLTKEEKWGKEKVANFDTLWNNRKGFYFKNHKWLLLNSEGIISIDFFTGEQQLEVPATRWKGKENLKIRLMDSKGIIWLETPNEILGFNTEKEQASNIRSIPYSESLGVQSLGEWNNEIYISQANLLNTHLQYFSKINNNDELEPLFEVPQGFTINQFVEGKIWCIGEQGWRVYDYQGTLLFELKKTDYRNLLFRGVDFTIITIDSKGKYYLPTDFGFNIIEVKENPFTQYFSNNPTSPLPINNAGRGIQVSNDTIIGIFEFGGMVLLQKDKPQKYDILLSKSINPFTKRIGQYYGRTVIQDTKGHFWTDDTANLLKWTTDLSNYEKTLDAEKIDGRGDIVWSLFEDKNGCIWSGFTKALRKVCPDSGISQSFFHQEAGFGSDFYELNVYQMQYQKDGLLWLCTSRGLFLFDTVKNKVVQHFNEDKEEKNFLPALEIFYLHIDKAGNRWLGTQYGLIYWNPRTDEKRLFTRKDGLSNNVIYAVFEDDFNRLWLSSNYGIMSFNKETFHVQTYLPKDGIAQEEFNRISHFQEPDGTIYFGGLNGITAFHPKDFSEKEENIKMTIASFEIFDGEEQKLLDKLLEINQTNTITFHPNDRFFRLNFTLPTFEETSNILYAWKVEGVDADWNYQKENTLQIGVLPYGNHVLRIKGQNGGGWSPHEIAIQIHVLKPFYLQIWFILLSVISVLLAAYLFYKRRMRLLKETQKLLKTEIKKATTKIERQTEELRQLDKIKSRFFANVSHELRTPLTLMLGPISSVLKSGELNNRSFTLLKKAQQGGTDLLKLVGSILDLSKMESAKMELHENPVTLFKFTRRITSAFESHAQREGVNFLYKYEGEPTLQLNLDKEKVEVILNNLLSNAIKFTAKGGKIAVKVEDLVNVVRMTVRDTGRGIHPNDLPHVFNRFYQSEQPDAPTEGGTGIGLALSQELVHLMGGRMWVESELSVGSSFFVELPRTEVLGTVQDMPAIPNEELQPTTIEAVSTSEVASSSSPLEAKGNKNQTILIVEDNYSLRDYLATILAPHYDILTAENGQVALEILNAPSSINNLPSAVISDIMMPVMDGYQLLEKIKTDEKLLHLPVIMLTARADIQDKLKALRIGVDDYLLKPFVEEELLVRIENLLENRDNRTAFLIENEEETTTKNDSPKISEEHLHWLKELETTLMSKIENTNYSLSDMSADFAMSDSTFTRQLKRLTGFTPVRYLQELRLNEARRILENREYQTVAKVAYKVGFKDANAFSRAFKKRYGKSPSAFNETN